MRQRRADDLDRADKVGIDLLPDLVVGQLLGGADQAVGRVVHHHVDAAQVSESVIYNAPYGDGVCHIEARHPEPLAMLRLKVIKSLDLRRVAATRSLRASKLSVISRPKPDDVPVMNQVLLMGMLLQDRRPRSAPEPGTVRSCYHTHDVA